MGQDWLKVGLVCCAVAVLAPVATSPARAGGWKIESPEAKSSIKIGFLAQGQYEALETADGMDTSQNLFLRRMRLMFGGQLSEKWSFFIETDSPNLGKSDAAGKKDAGNVYIQDAVFMYNASDQFKVDVGMILIPFSHNSTQSAATLLPVDYGPYSFLASSPTKSNVGRDYGVQLRGYLANKHFEYRAGVYDGDRGPNAKNPLRYAARVVYYPFESDGFYYTGTTLGKKRILAIGAGYDKQSDYRAWSGDIFYDQPLSGGNGLTAQVGFYHYDGDVFLPSLPKQDAKLVELGFYFGGVKLQPFGTWYERDYDDASRIDEKKWQIGLAWLPVGYARVLKLAYGKIDPDVGESRDQLILQLQVLEF